LFKQIGGILHTNPSRDPSRLDNIRLFIYRVKTF
jgi:hypothetical protein